MTDVDQLKAERDKLAEILETGGEELIAEQKERGDRYARMYVEARSENLRLRQALGKLIGPVESLYASRNLPNPLPAWDQVIFDALAEARAALVSSPTPKEEAEPICQCWNEGQWGRVHREDCPIHSGSVKERNR